ncbi:Swt1 family HEPN domain-containing protein [Reyranella sp.]|uniref:Swt1 family HEPN domain-containing protein n=1 Tax=Reyranella sp. TaxID=1929291 RepID=UPI004034FE69
MNNLDRAYSFVMKAHLTEEALDNAGRMTRRSVFHNQEELETLASISVLDERHVAAAREMAVVYVAIAAFENSVRELISRTLLEDKGEDWWSTSVSEKIRMLANQRMEEEVKVRWHSQRGQDPINFTMLPNLLNIIRQNFSQFEPFIHNIDWAAQIFDAIERSRNVIMHSGTLAKRDVARVGSLINDWSRQVAT